MKILRIALHAFVLVVLDISGIAVGAMVAYAILGTANQVWLQLPVALTLSIGLFFVWMLSLRKLGFTKLQFAGAAEPGACLLTSVLVGVVVFVPVHYFTQGYLTGAGNLVAIALYQLFANAIAVYVWAGLTYPDQHSKRQNEGFV